jgi:beta-lactam-binding protein with PASTA domain
VPSVVGLVLTKARTRLVRAHCKVGKITKSASTLRKKGKVVAQTPKAGTKLRNGAKVSLKIGSGPARKRN